MIVSSAPIEIVSNFPAFKAELEEVLKQYSIEVTEENLSAAKKAATDLNKKAEEIKKRKIEKAKEFALPIKTFEAQAMELVDMCLKGREKILEQVKVFEDKTRKLCLELMQIALGEQYELSGVRDEFRNGFAKLPGMVGISHVTPAGSLKKAAVDAVAALAVMARGIQDRTDGRLSRLEAECLKAGLRSALDPSSVEGVLQAEDAAYNAHLTRIIGVELKRQQAAEAKIREEEEAKARKKIEEENRIAQEKVEKEAREAKQKADQEAREKARAETPPPAPPTPQAPPPPPTPQAQAASAPPPARVTQSPYHGVPSRKQITVVVRFSVNAKIPVNEVAIRAWFEGKIAASGIEDPFSIRIEEVCG